MSHPIHSICRRLPPFPGSVPDHTRRHNSATPRATRTRPESPQLEVTSEQLMKSYLASHPEIMEEYVTEFVSAEKLEDWLKKKKEKHPRNETSTDNMYRPKIVQRFLEPDIIATQQNLMDEINEKRELTSMLYDMANIICKSIQAQNFSVYAKGSKEELCIMIPCENTDSGTKLELKSFCPIEEGTTIAAYVAKTNKVVLVQDTITDERFPQGTGIEGSLNCSVIAAPVITPSQDVLCVMQFTRNVAEPFSEKELQTVSTFLTWIGIGIYQSQVNRTLNTQADLNDFLLELTKIIFDDVVKMDKLVEKIMMFTKDLVNADRCCLFLVDADKKELYANLFDEGEYENGAPVFVKKDEIRFPLHAGIAGTVATTGEIINIPDAYADDRFLKDIDQETGYITKSILSMPIISNGIVIGVVQMLNKKCQVGFTNADVQSFRTFSVYSALALHYSKMFRDLKIQTAHHNVAQEQLNYHAVCDDKAVNDQMKRPLEDSQIPDNLDKLDFYIEQPSQEPLMNKLMVYMLSKIGKPLNLEPRLMYRFILTVKKNYRPMPYHNWIHGWTVAHNMYSMFRLIQQGPRADFVDPLRSTAYLVAALCHDVDHRGYNNNFIQLSKDPLSTLYEHSPMERHHYVMTVRILQRDQHNIFSHLSPEDYKEVLVHIENAIMATDLAVYLKNIKSFAEMVVTNQYDLDKRQHCDDILANMMTAADLCVMLKAWPIHREVTLALYEEFWSQGDFEKLLGKTPIAMMDRNRQNDLPKNQVGFMEFVCMPCYSTLAAIFPELRSAVELIKENLAQWEAMLQGRSHSVWEPAKSLPQPV